MKKKSVKKSPADLVIFAGQVVSADTDKPDAIRGRSMKTVSIINEGGVAIRNGKILAVGEKDQIKERYQAKKTMAFPQATLTPGLVDCHTHLVFAGDRVEDFYARIQGTSYEEIAKQGGGILHSVKLLREASKEDLKKFAHKRLKQILRHGTTTCEVKSGYGLTLEDELKTLEVIKELQKEQPISLVPTFLGAHEVPVEFRSQREGYIDLICNQMLPIIAKKRLARFCDIFCEKNVFSIAESERVLACARENGFALKLHVDELADNFGGSVLAARLQAVSADHLVMVSSFGIKALAAGDTIAVLLPATTFFLAKERYAPARDILEADIPVALGTDLNPGSSNTENFQAVMTLAAVKLKMSPEEILIAVTHNAACAIQESQRVGRLQAGLAADLVVWDVDDFRKIPYHFAGNRVLRVFKAGKEV